MDVGLIFLDHRFTIPNFPSRVLDYLNASLPVIAAVDFSTDLGKIIYQNGAGLYCESNDVNAFLQCVDKMRDKEFRISCGRAAKELVLRHFNVALSADNLLSYFKL